jgi:hypothetical protein
VVDRLNDELLRHAHALEAYTLETYTLETLDIENALREKRQALDPEDFVGVIRPAFEQDEWMLLVGGGILDAARGDPPGGGVLRFLIRPAPPDPTPTDPAPPDPAPPDPAPTDPTPTDPAPQVQRVANRGTCVHWRPFCLFCSVLFPSVLAGLAGLVALAVRTSLTDCGSCCIDSVSTSDLFYRLWRKILQKVAPGARNCRNPSTYFGRSPPNGVWKSSAEPLRACIEGSECR